MLNNRCSLRVYTVKKEIPLELIIEKCEIISVCRHVVNVVTDYSQRHPQFTHAPFHSTIIILIIRPRGHKLHVFSHAWIFEYKSYLQKLWIFSTFTDNFILLLTIFIDICRRNEQNDKIYIDRYSTAQPECTFNGQCLAIHYDQRVYHLRKTF